MSYSRLCPLVAQPWMENACWRVCEVALGDSFVGCQALEHAAIGQHITGIMYGS